MSVKKTNVRIETPAGDIRVYRKYFDGLGEDVGLSCCDLCCGCGKNDNGCWPMTIGLDCRDYEPDAPDRKFACFFRWDYEEVWL